jgi:2,4-dienoyl-CoA reductase (NADPH2)
MISTSDARRHRRITQPVHDAGGKILLQVLHAGRYAYHPFSVSASSIKAPINPFRPRKLSSRGVDSTIDDFARCAELAREAGYDGVEIMGSEGYLLNQFLAPHTNKRTDAWGGTPEKRRRMPVEIVRRTRARRSGLGTRPRGLRRNGVEPHIIGGAALAAELDAKRAIRQGTELAAKL